MTGLTRRRAAEIIAKHFDTAYNYDGGSYDAYSAYDEQGRRWKVMSDASIRTECRSGTPTSEHKVELVSPICVWEDIETIQQIVRELRHAGAISNNSCGIHVHVDASRFDARSLRNITNIMASKEDLIYKALQVDVDREYQYCKKVDECFLEDLNRKKPKTIEKVKDIWYDGDDGSREHYHHSRYHCLNLHSVFSKGTIEFRLFNSDIRHAGKIKAYIQLSLAITHQALSQTCASRRKTVSSNEKYTFRTWLLRLGLNGDEFKTARTHLLEHLEGNIAWKRPEQALEQRERLRQKAALVTRERDEIQNQQAEPEAEHSLGLSL